VLVPTLLLDNGCEGEQRSCEVKFFHNVPAADGTYEAVASEKASDVIMRTAAAPTYFPR
jgi:patatin-like phospholipase/acyl hydrolase